MFRFKKGSKLGTRHYLRQDGTTTYFFTQEEMKTLVENAGFRVEVNDVIERRTINKKEDIDVTRLFLQGKYRKKSDWSLVMYSWSILVMQQNGGYEIDKLLNVLFLFSFDSRIKFLEELIGMPDSECFF